ncbi:serine hydrolase domain-containing protein [Lignipirellula cremea]|uniref:Esterase EstB n=1 Tax=Lignipirellula cremea TaxID=2528010 RepID=A0A518DNL8_9BACT|nr:serine hydrolase domain-containing protein [Lignipirellula cremea]QDU93403.1 Esterase EstB [Lignipirellula cremea]
MKRCGWILVVWGVLGLFTSRTTRAEAPVSALQPFVDRHELAGAVMLVADAQKVLSIETVGYADIAAGKPMRKDTLFWIASQTKPMTAVAVMMLVDEGKIALDEPVEKYLPEFRGQQLAVVDDNGVKKLTTPAHPITIREVLSHMSGLPFRSAAETPTLDALTLEAAVKTYAQTPLQTQPGTHYQYSNAGINTAARILEVVSGQKYETFLQERLLDPLGMTDTTFWPNEEQIGRLAKSYRPDQAKTNLVEFPLSQLGSPLSDRAHRFPMPAGGLFSTAANTARFCQMLLAGGQWNGRQVLSQAAFAELTRRQTPDSVPNSYGLGLMVHADGFGHGGAHATNMDIRPAEDRVLIWMVQHSGFPGKGVQAQGVFKRSALQKQEE